MLRYSRVISCLAVCLLSAAVLAAGELAAPEVKYAAVVYALAPDAPAGPDKDNEDNVRYLLADPMVGNFTLDQMNLAKPGNGGLAELAKAAGEHGGNASLSFFFLNAAACAELAKTGSSPGAFVAGLPGNVKVLVDDRASQGGADARPTLSVAVEKAADGPATVEFAFEGSAGGPNTVAAILFDALRGNADKDKNRRITLSELAAFMSSKAAASPTYDLGSLGDLLVVKYRTPAEVAASLGPDKSLLLAANYISQQRWIESLLVLREIRDSKITDPEYRKISETAQLNLALEARYSPDSKAENMSRDVDAGLELASDVLLLANLHYVDDADNRALFAGGIKNLQLLLENKRVRGELITPENAPMAREFSLFLKETLEHVYEKDSLPESDFLMRVKRVLMEDDATVKIPAGAVVTEFVYGIPAALDPNTDFIPRKAYKEFQDDTKGRFGGIGIEITLEDKILTVVTPLDGTPAVDAGLLPGDRIIAIEGESADGIDLVDAVNKLRGPIGTKVTITIVHRGDTTPLDVTITRGNITIESIKGYALDPGTGQWNYWLDPDNKIGYVRLTDFKENTPEELEKVVDALVDQGMKSLVLDLRFNHGGLLTSGVQISDCFLTGGTIVTMQGAHTKPVIFRAHYFKTFKDFPVVVLVNDQSASAAEILAGALQDNKRATIVGTRTFGKGTVQTVFELEHGMSALKLTTARYYTPNGASIHREPYSDKGGLTPDVAVPMNDEQNSDLVAVWHLRGLKQDARQRLVEKEKELAARNPDYKMADPDTFKDPQLDKALDILHGGTKPAQEVHVAGSGANEGTAATP